MNLKSIHSPALVILALIPLLSPAETVRSDPASVAVASHEITVTRVSPHTSQTAFEQDVPLAELTGDTASIISKGPDGMDEVDVADELVAEGWQVLDVTRDNNTYVYVIDPDGYVRQICTVRGRITVYTGVNSPSEIILAWTQDI